MCFKYCSTCFYLTVWVKPIYALSPDISVSNSHFNRFWNNDLFWISFEWDRPFVICSFLTLVNLSKESETKFVCKFTGFCFPVSFLKKTSINSHHTFRISIDLCILISSMMVVMIHKCIISYYQWKRVKYLYSLENSCQLLSLCTDYQHDKWSSSSVVTTVVPNGMTTSLR